MPRRSHAPDAPCGNLYALIGHVRWRTAARGCDGASLRASGDGRKTEACVSVQNRCPTR